MRRLFPLLLTAALTGCITQTETVFTEPASPEDALEKRVALARQYIGQGNWDAAKRNLKVASELDDSNPEVFEAFALVYQSTGESELAEENFRRAISLDKKFSRARNNYAAFLYGQERYREAEAQLLEVVKDTLYNARPQAFLNLGLCRLKLFDERGAEEAFLRTLAMQRDNTVALLEVAQLRLDAGDSRNASLYYDKYRELVRQQSARALWLGVRLARATGDADALGSYSMALRNRYPESAEYEAYQRSLGSEARDDR
jgi:type IV pilus assembly protein PilF